MAQEMEQAAKVDDTSISEQLNLKSMAMHAGRISYSVDTEKSCCRRLFGYAGSPAARARTSFQLSAARTMRMARACMVSLSHVPSALTCNCNPAVTGHMPAFAHPMLPVQCIQQVGHPAASRTETRAARPAACTACIACIAWPSSTTAPKQLPTLSCGRGQARTDGEREHLANGFKSPGSSQSFRVWSWRC